MVVGAVMPPACFYGGQDTLAVMLSASSLALSEHCSQEAPTQPREGGPGGRPKDRFGGRRASPLLAGSPAPLL